MSPFDIVKSLTQTKNDLYESEEIEDKDYVPFMINRILVNSRQTALFAAAMNQYGCLDKKLQYDFFRLGLPKTRAYTKWVKKDDSEVNQEHIDYICQSMGVSTLRALDMYKILGGDVVQKEIDKQGGRK